MKIVVPIIRTFRNGLVRFAPNSNKNWLLRRILYLLGKLECLLNCSGEAYLAYATIKPTLTFVRAPDDMALRTTISNLGADFPATILEGGKIVAVVPPGQSRTIGICGAFLIQGRCQGGITSVEVLTHRRCTCGDEYHPPYGVGVKAIGADLI